MKILLSSYSFDPNIGGIESVSRIMATEFARLEHEVKVVTQTTMSGDSVFPFEVIRGPAPHQLIKLVRWADVYFQSHISLILGWPLLFVRKPWVVMHHTWLPREGSAALKSRLKRCLLRFAIVVPISRGIADDIPAAARVIGSPYDAAIFRHIPTVNRKNELVFVGRLVSDKGAHLILEALSLLRRRGCVYRLTIVGSGPDQDSLRGLVDDLGLADQVSFVGAKAGSDLAATLNEHRILVVPSVWEEPFGIVALEACACGCSVIGSDSGGLPDAIGPCGVTFPNGDVGALADRIGELSSQTDCVDSCQDARSRHLANHSPRSVAAAYLHIFESAVRAKGRS
jgi:glycosyltransferase involved in cell wall biosynthesis